MGQIERRAVKLDAPAALRSPRNVTRDIVVADDEPLDLDALDPLGAGVSPIANLPSSPAAFTSISRSRVICSFVRSSTTCPVPGTSAGFFQPASATDRLGRVQVEPNFGLGAHRHRRP